MSPNKIRYKAAQPRVVGILYIIEMLFLEVILSIEPN